MIYVLLNFYYPVSVCANLQLSKFCVYYIGKCFQFFIFIVRLVKTKSLSLCFFVIAVHVQITCIFSLCFIYWTFSFSFNAKLTLLALHFKGVVFHISIKLLYFGKLWKHTGAFPSPSSIPVVRFRSASSYQVRPSIYFCTIEWYL